MLVPFENRDEEKHEIGIGHERFECSILTAVSAGDDLSEAGKLFSSVHDAADEKHGCAPFVHEFDFLHYNSLRRKRKWWILIWVLACGLSIRYTGFVEKMRKKEELHEV
jgi:hypothetical protein